jgi:GNAT superfamily N-acetyltransferase
MTGFARVVNDGATFAYLCDVFVVPAWRGRGVAKSVMECIKTHPDLQRLRRWLLATRDARGLHAQFGFSSLSALQRCMEIHDPHVYQVTVES